MKTAKEYIEEYGYCDGDQFGVKEVSEIINKARKEAIEEACESAKIKWIDIEYDEEKKGMICEPEIDKQSILSLINELK
jgi:3-dehydroquinate dehydratase